MIKICLLFVDCLNQILVVIFSKYPLMLNIGMLNVTGVSLMAPPSLKVKSCGRNNGKMGNVDG